MIIAKRFLQRSSLAFLLLLFFVLTPVFSDDWVLGAQKFTFVTSATPVGVEQIATLLPQLILEQISTGSTRVLPTNEVLSRTLDSLQTERLSLFLQLSKEYKTRDALAVNVYSSRKLLKQIAQEEEKIKEIEAKIEENLSKVESETSSHQAAIEREEAISRGELLSDDSSSEEKRFPFQLPFPFFRQSEEEERVSETIALYKNDLSALFTPSEAALAEGIDSRTFEKEVTQAKINGLLSGSIVSYGDYIAVTVDVHLFPGAKNVATVTDVGMKSDLLSLAERLSRALTPKLTNALPLVVHIQILPQEAAQKALLTLDGIVFQPIPRELSVDAGIHTLSVAAPGYESVSTSYLFEGREQYDMKVSLVPEVKGVLSLRLKKLQNGIFYANGGDAAPVTVDEPVGQIFVNGKAVMGIFTTGKGESETSSFIYVPARLAKEENQLVVNAKPYDRAANIDKRRRRMYTAYSALICSLPVTFYFVGNFTAVNNAYAMGRADYEDAIAWQNRMYISLGVTAVCGAWTIFELFRYLRAANEVLPAEAHKDKKES